MISKFPDNVRQYLEWSFNYARAEELSDDSVKGVAREISIGIPRGEDALDEHLAADFLENRVDDLDMTSNESLVDPDNWTPDPRDRDNPLTWVELVAAIRGLEEFPELLEQAKAAREEE
jgi:hypothetical protein